MNRLSLIPLLVSCLGFIVSLSTAVAATNPSVVVEFSSVLHFLTPAGDDVEVGPGRYEVETVESWLKLVAEGEAPASAVLLESTTGTHEAKLTDSEIRLEQEADNPDVFHLAILLTDGTGLEAVGTVSGIRPRGFNLVFVAKPSQGTTPLASALPLSRPNVNLDQQTIGLPKGEKPKVCGPFQKEIPGNHEGNRLPALAVFQNQLHLVTSFDGRCTFADVPGLFQMCKNIPDYQPLIHRIYKNGKWESRKAIPNQFSKKGVGLAVLSNRLYMVHLGYESNQLWHSTYDGNTWTPNVKIPGQKSKKRPALVTFQNRIHLVHLGDSSNDLWHSMFIPSRGWTVNVRIPGQKSKNTPGLAVYGNRLHMVHAGDSSDDLWHSSFSRNQWSKNMKIAIDSKYSPTLAFSANNSTPWMELVHFEKGSSALYHSLYGRHLRGGRTWVEWFDAKPLASLNSDSSVGMAFYEGCWHMVSVKNNKLMHTTFATSEIHSNVR